MAIIKLDANKLLLGMEETEQKAIVAIKMLAQQGAIKFQNYAKQNARWTDRTGHARQRLVGYIEKMPDAIRIHIAHGVDYGKWLELANEGKYAILKQTVYANSKEVLEGYNRLIEHLR